MLSDPALIAAVALLVPLMGIVAYTDTRDLRIPNWTVLAVLGVFLATGSWGLPFETFLWRLGYAAVAFGLSLLLYNVAQGGIGAGDLKLMIVLVPFLSGAILVDFLLIYVAVSVLGSLAFWAARRALKGRSTGWKALDTAVYYPVGVYIGIAITAALFLELVVRLG
ncbi:hypothetical protein LNKW23_21560 [Paralimibaculum aggregatum]|uniref:Prepilin type IV endopeptidase peptidase domain-containing protein n=1 Tax=Paralimibaculum aggregatum TaxID=3036245 RepID=A0ABQ6LPT1_9RHOB|nr:prepilin peptidase [Limibaculum sp. NKW23]GMG82943.1 hypothetical protein LNKW23_21560 [Limibaculum sp. NKW23]